MSTICVHCNAGLAEYRLLVGRELQDICRACAETADERIFGLPPGAIMRIPSVMPKRPHAKPPGWTPAQVDGRGPANGVTTNLVVAALMPIVAPETARQGVAESETMSGPSGVAKARPGANGSASSRRCLNGGHR